jgi:hypothetical protein
VLLAAAPDPQESFGQLFQSLVSVLTRLGQYPFHYGPKPGFPPVVPSGRLRTGRITEMGTLKQGAGCRGIEPRIIPVREWKPRRYITGSCVLVYKRSRHPSVYSDLAGPGQQ